MQLENVNGVDMPTWSGVAGAKLHLVDNMERWKAFYSRLMLHKLVAADTETTGFRWFKDHHMVGASFGWEFEHFYIPFRHEASVLGGPPGPQIDFEDVKDDLVAFFAQEDVFTLWHNWKFDAHFYAREGVPILTQFHDTRTLWHFLDENAPGRLKTIASGWKDEQGKWNKGLIHKDAGKKEKEIDKWRSEESRARKKVFTAAVMQKAVDLASEPEFQGMNKTQLKKHIQLNILQDHPYANTTKDSVHYGCIPIPLMCEYAGLDTFFTYTTYKHCIKEIAWTERLKELYVNECKLSRALKRVEENGIHINSDFLRAASIQFAQEEEKLEEEIKQVLGEEVNLASPQQLADALINHGIVLTKQTDAGNFCVDKGVLQKLAKEYPIVNELLRLRLIKKLRNTYVDSILEKLVDDRVLRCNFNQNVSTGRMSANDPNLTNIPGADDTIRQAFIPPDDDFVYIFADYSQIEVRLTAHYSQDPLLLDAYAKGQDIHTRTMCEVFGEFYDEAVKILGDKHHPRHKELKFLRTVTKRINFGIIYGVGAPGLSEQIDKDKAGFADSTQKEWVAQCQKYIDDYLAKYLGVKRFINKISRIVATHSKVENGHGRVRHLPHAKATKLYKDRSLYWLEARAKRQGVNFLIQGDAADVFKKAVVRVDEYLLEQNAKTKIVNLVHDEIQLYVHKSEFHLLKGIKERMEDFPQYSIPILVDFEWTTKNWASKQEL